MVSLISCTITTGEGPVVEKGFAHEAFSAVELDGSFDLNINQGAIQNVVVSGNENIIDKLQMTVSDNVLYLSLEPGNYMNYDLDVNVTIPTIERVTLNGSGDINLNTFVGIENLVINLDGSGDIRMIEESACEVLGKTTISLEGSGDIDLKLKANSVVAELDGSGDIDLAGIAKSLKATLDGSGDIKSYDLETLKAEVTLDGSGNIKVYASKTLKATLDGSGDIEYRGEPKLEASIDGAGTISAD